VKQSAVVRVCPVCGRPGAGAEVRCPHDGASLVVLESNLEARETDLLGQVVDGRYRVESVVGRGGMGVVFAARHVVVGRRVALKVLKPSMEHTEDTLQRFVREAQAANAVRSPYILRADDFGQLGNGAFYVVMDLLEGASLGDALRERRLGHDVLLEVFAQVADGLGAAHAAGVVHRDLKPDNVFLVAPPGGTPAPGAAGPQVRILDFGVAKLMHQGAQGLTETGVILGTPYYMSPEQARGLDIDHRADIYALGVVMYQAFTGRLPFLADSAVGVLTAHAVDDPAPPSLSGVDVALEGIILRCMQKRPEHRFQTMSDVSAALRQRRTRTVAGQPPPLDETQARPQSFGGASPLPSFVSQVTYPAPSSGRVPSGSYATAPSASLPAALQASSPGMSAVSMHSGALHPGALQTGPVVPGQMPPPSTDTGTAMSAIAAPPTSRGLYLALGAALAIVGVLAAMLVVGRDRAPAAAETTKQADVSPAAPATPAVTPTAATEPTPVTTPSAVPTLQASAAPVASSAPGPGTGTGPRPVGPRPAATPTTPAGTAAPKPPTRPEIRSPFD
jgi:serine/threonine protein kinase